MVAAHKTARVTVAYSADERMAMPLAASIASAIANFKSADSFLDVVVVGSGLSPRSASRIFPHSADASRFRFRIVSPPAISTEEIDLGRYGVAALYRLLIPQLLPDCSRAIYLDADTIVEQDLRELWEEACGEAALWARQDWMFPVMSHPYLQEKQKWLGMQPDDPYFNSGVLVFDLDVWRDADLGNQVLSFLRANIAHCSWFDQDALNAVLRGRWKPLNARWNRYSSEISSREAAGIIHYIGAEAKPWLAHAEPNWANRRFLHYLQTTAWATSPDPGRQPAEGRRRVADQETC
jgi:lipopolysaccharide biosynthesis glycosyltransferase